MVENKETNGDNPECSYTREIYNKSSTDNMFISIRDIDADKEYFKDNAEIMEKITEYIITDLERARNKIAGYVPEKRQNANKASYRRIYNCSNTSSTLFASKIDLVADYQRSYIMFVSDETFGSASNLIKTSVAKENKEPWEIENEEDGSQNGWLVKRHEPNAFVIIQLGVSGTISGVDVDLTGYKQCAPITVTIVGHLRDSPGKWTKILPEVFIESDSHNLFEINNSDVYSHIQITMVPGSGITRLRVYGDVVPPYIPIDTIVNLASTMFGSQVIQKPVNIVRGSIPNIILNRADSSYDGWISARNKNTADIPQYTTIKLAAKGVIDRFIVDTKHFIGNAPKAIVIQGYSANDQDVNNIESTNWINLIDDEEDQIQQNIFPNMLHIIPCTYMEPITHIRVQPIPDGGIQQVIAKGRVYLENKKSPLKEASASEPIASNNKRKHEESQEKSKRVSLRLSKRHQ